MEVSEGISDYILVSIVPIVSRNVGLTRARGNDFRVSDYILFALI